ncbi:MAG TPA: magnesium/cobalt transporter CorA [Pantanalinema sp.]
MPIKIVSHKDLTWYDISHPTRHDIDWLEENFSFHPLDFEDVVSRLQRPKLDEYDDYLFVVLHFPVFDKQQQVTQPAEIDIFVGEGFLITIHVSKIWPLERFFEACEGSEKVREDDMGLGSGHLLYRVMDKLVDNFFPIAYKIERNVQAIEDEIFEQSGRETVEKISLLRRDIIAYRRIVKPLIPVISRLEYVKSRLIGEELELYFSDIGDALARLWDMLEDQKGIIESLNDTYDSLTTHRTNEVIRALTVISVIMLPLTLLSGIYGMNVHLPIGDWPFAFEAVIGMMVLLATLMVGFFRHKKWI